MIRRALLHITLAVALVLSGLTAVVAETRMAASGGYCGTGAPQLLLDAAGMPLLDADGAALAAPDCPACVIALAALTASAPTTAAPLIALGQSTPTPAPALSPDVVRLGGQARAPPPVA